MVLDLGHVKARNSVDLTLFLICSGVSVKKMADKSLLALILVLKPCIDKDRTNYDTYLKGREEFAVNESRLQISQTRSYISRHSKIGILINRARDHALYVRGISKNVAAEYEVMNCITGVREAVGEGRSSLNGNE